MKPAPARTPRARAGRRATRRAGRDRQGRFSPDGETIATGDLSGNFNFWDPSSGRRVGRTLGDQNGYVISVSYNPTGTELVTTSTDGRFRLWDLASGKLIGAPLPGGDTGGWGGFFPNGKKVLAVFGSGIGYIWNVDPAAWNEQACRVAHRQLLGVMLSLPTTTRRELGQQTVNPELSTTTSRQSDEHEASGCCRTQEMREFRRNRLVIATMGLMPLVFVSVPLLIIFLTPASASVAQARAAVGVVSLMLLIVPVVIPPVIAAYAVVGERDQGTLEPILTAPIRASELLLGKAVRCSYLLSASPTPSTSSLRSSSASAPPRSSAALPSTPRNSSHNSSSLR